MARLYFESPASASDHNQAPAVPAPRGGGRRILLVTTLFMGLILGGVALQSLPDTEDVLNARAEITAQAARQGRLVVVYFSGRNCPACVKMEHQAWTDKRVTAHLEQSFLLWHLHPEDPSYDQVAEAYSVTAPPAVVITSASGRVLTDEHGEPRRYNGYLSAEDLPVILSSVQAGMKPEKPRTERASRRERKREIAPASS